MIDLLRFTDGWKHPYPLQYHPQRIHTAPQRRWWSRKGVPQTLRSHRSV